LRGFDGDSEVDVNSSAASGSAQLWTGRSTLTGAMDPAGFAPTNRPVEMTGVSIWEFRGKRLSRVSEYFDTHEQWRSRSGSFLRRGRSANGSGSSCSTWRHGGCVAPKPRP